MCIILVKPPTVAKSTIEKETLYNCWQGNPHGAGLMFSYHGKLVVWKGMMTYAKFLEAWNMVPQHATIVAHFRIATHGKRDESMTHPFWVQTHKLAMVHNGILAIKARESDGLSDTATFVEDVLKALPEDWLDNASIVHLIDGYAGYGNKLVFLTNTGRTLILNEKAGQWDGGCWFSNGSYKRVVFTSYNYPDNSVVNLSGKSMRERWSKKEKKEKKSGTNTAGLIAFNKALDIKQPDPNKEAARQIVTECRGRHRNNDDEVCRELGITKEELEELTIGQDDEAAIRDLEVQIEKDRLDQYRENNP